MRFPLARRYNHLLTGPISAAARSGCEPPGHQSASLWWPGDRAWWVATDIDLMTTYVGGSSECVDELVGSAHLEALPVPAGQPITWDADQVNPLPPPPRS